MARWIDRRPVEVLLRTSLEQDDYIDGLIDHAQALAELEIDEQTDPSTRLKALLANIVARMWQAGKSAEVNPAGLQSETSGSFTIQDTRGGVAGLGLTNSEKAALKKAAGISDLWTQPTTRSDMLETAPAPRTIDADEKDPIELLSEAQQGIRGMR